MCYYCALLLYATNSVWAQFVIPNENFTKSCFDKMFSNKTTHLFSYFLCAESCIDIVCQGGGDCVVSADTGHPVCQCNHNCTEAQVIVPHCMPTEFLRVSIFFNLNTSNLNCTEAQVISSLYDYRILESLNFLAGYLWNRGFICS